MTDFAAARTAMVDCQIRPADVTTYPIIAAMLDIPREKFVPAELRAVAYMGENVPLGPRRTLLDPRVFAKMLDALEIGPESLVLDIGSGYGYSSAVLSRLAAAVVAVESDEDLVVQALRALPEVGADTVITETRALVEGAPEHGPFDAMLIEGGVEAIPEALIDQVKEGGRVVAIFMDGHLGKCRVGTRINGAMSWTTVFDATAPVLPGFDKAEEFAI